MPIYEFRCSECGHRFELLLPMDSEKDQPCSSCGKTASRILSPTAGVVISSSASNHGNMNCSRQSPCCGRNQPCDIKPCER